MNELATQRRAAGGRSSVDVGRDSCQRLWHASRMSAGNVARARKDGAFIVFAATIAATACGGLTQGAASRPAPDSGTPVDAMSSDSTLPSANGGAGTSPSADGGAGTLPSANGGSGADGPAVDDAEAATESCPLVPPALQPGGTIVTFQTDPYLDGRPMIMGQPNALAGGGTLTPLDLRFFISNVHLVRNDGTDVPVDIVSAAGAPDPYGIHLLNADDAASTAWSIRAPVGSYRGMNLTLGIVHACDTGFLPPVGEFSPDSMMTWPPPFGYLFLRFEAQVAGADGGPSGGDGTDGGTPDAIAMGGTTFGSQPAPVVHVEGALTVPASGSLARHLLLEMDQVLKGAITPADTSGMLPAPPPGGPNGPPSGDELDVGERLRQAAPSLPLFVLGP